MHAILFTMKRAHHAGLRLSRPLMRRVGLTPARFDMLFALFDEGLSAWGRRRGFSRGVLQARLSKALGVCRMTVSRMVRSLEDLGLVHRDALRPGSRRRMVRLTERGDAKVRRLVREVLDRGDVDFALDCLIAPRVWFTRHEAFARKEQLQDVLRCFLQQLGDRARLPYTWHPDD